MTGILLALELVIIEPKSAHGCRADGANHGTSPHVANQLRKSGLFPSRLANGCRFKDVVIARLALARDGPCIRNAAFGGKGDAHVLDVGDAQHELCRAYSHFGPVGGAIRAMSTPLIAQESQINTLPIFQIYFVFY